MKLTINKFEILVLSMLLFNSCKMKSQIFGYGEECEKMNSIELVRVIFECVKENKIGEILESSNYDAILGVNIAINNKGEIVKLRVRDSSTKLSDIELNKITLKLKESDFKFKSCVHDNYFKTNKEDLLERVKKNYKGGNVPVYIRFPGDLLKDGNDGTKVEKIKRYVIN